MFINKKTLVILCRVRLAKKVIFKKRYPVNYLKVLSNNQPNTNIKQLPEIEKFRRMCIKYGQV
jgi:hypothetical protein